MKSAFGGNGSLTKEAHILQFRGGCDNQALSLLETAIKRGEDKYWAYSEMGNVYVNLGKYDLAIQSYVLAINEYKGDYAYSGKGHAHYHKREYKEALASFEEAIRINPLNSMAQHWKGNCLAALGRYPEAKKQLEYALSVLYQNDERHGFIAEVKKDLDEVSRKCSSQYQQRYESNESFSIEKTAIQIAMPYFQKGQVEFYNGQYETAIAYFKSALSKYPDYIESHLWMGRAYYCLKQYDESISVFSKAMELTIQNNDTKLLTSIQIEIKNARRNKELEDISSKEIHIHGNSAPVNIGGIQANDDAIINRSSVKQEKKEEDSKFCPQCGSLFEPTDIFCRYCGRKLK